MIETTLDNASKLWVYQANRSFLNDEVNAIEQMLQKFVAAWQSHGEDVTGYFKVIKNRFIVLIADDSTMVSGCSIDSSVAIVRQIEKEFNVDLLDKSHVAFEKENESIETIHISKIPEAVKENKIKPDTLIYNNSISSLSELDKNWKVKAKDSWMNRYFA